MTIPACAHPLGSRMPSTSEREAANQLRSILAARAEADQSARLKLIDGTGNAAEVVLLPALSQLLTELLRHVGQGNAVTLVPVSQMLTTQQAADVLNVSRPHLIKLLDQGMIPHSKVGRHRRIKADDLFEFKTRRDDQRAEALSELAALDADHF